MRRRGQIHLSFSMLVSIIVIISVVAVAFYVINNFLNYWNCTQVGLFYEDLRTITLDARDSQAGYSDIFVGKLPSNIKEVCIGNLSARARDVKKEFDLLKNEAKLANVFLYPPKSGCDLKLSYNKIEYIENQNFFCVRNVDGKVKLKVEKNSGGLVLLSPVLEPQ